MKVLHAVHGFPPEFYGGTELYVERLARSQAEAGDEVVVVAGTNVVAKRAPATAAATDGDGPQGPDPGAPAGAAAELGLDESSRRFPFRVYRMHREGMFHERWDHGSSPAVAGAFRGLLRSERVDVVHVHHWLRLTRDLVRLAHAEGVPAVLTLHDLFSTCPRAFRVRPGESFCERPLGPASCTPCVPRESWASDGLVDLQVDWFAHELDAELRAAAARIVPSRAHAAALARFTSFEEGDFRVVPAAWGAGAVRISEHAPWRPGAERPLRLAHWGHLHPAKGVHVLLEALRALPAGAVELVLWGEADDADYARRLAALAEGLAVERRMRFERTELAQLRADLAVFPSLAHESWSFVLDEAFASGLPVVVSDSGAPAERCGRAGLRFPPGDAAALAAQLSRVLAGEVDLGDMRSAIPEPVTAEEHRAAVAAVYESARASAPAAPPDMAVDLLLRYEALARALEDGARELEGLREREESEKRNLRGDVEDLGRSVAAFRGRNAEVESDLAAHRERARELEEDLAQHKLELERARADFRAAEGDVVTQRERAERFAAELVGQGEGIQGLRDEIERYRVGTEALVAERDAYVAGHDALVADREALAEQRVALEAERAALAGELEHLRTECDRLAAENRLAFPLVALARLWHRIKNRHRTDP